MRPSRHRGSDAISPTAHYTGHVWVRNGLSHRELATRQGRLLFDALAPTMTLSHVLGGATLEAFLLARHRIIDSLLRDAIERDGVTQVIEVACGMSPRGWRFAKRYGTALTYVEGDLPAMAERKRLALARTGPVSDSHRVVELDATLDEGPASIAEVAGTLDPDKGLAILSEGLLNYYPRKEMLSMWRGFADAASSFSRGCYFADIRLDEDNRGLTERAFFVGLSAFVRGSMHMHFADEAEAATALQAAGFASARLHRASEHPAGADAGPGAELIHVIDAAT